MNTTPHAGDPRFDVDRVMAHALAANEAAVAEHGHVPPTRADVVDAAYTAFGIGLQMMAKGRYAEATPLLRMAVENNVEIARPMLTICLERAASGAATDGDAIDVDELGPCGMVVTEHAVELVGGDMQVRIPAEEIDDIYPVALWTETRQRQGATVWQRRIIVVEGWKPVPDSGRRVLRPGDDVKR